VLAEIITQFWAGYNL